MKYLIVIMFFSLLSCGPGDVSNEISDGYYFYYSSKYQTDISYYGKDRAKGIVIQSSVKQFYLYKENIFVSRRPIKRDAEGKVNQGDCEYWIINVKSHSIIGPLNFKHAMENSFWIDLSKSDDAKELKARELECQLV